MTHREAMRTALLELGIDERKVTRSIAKADQTAGAHRGYVQVPQGTERELIESIKERWLLFKLIGKEGRKEILRRTQDENLNSAAKN